ncbi:MAG: type VI secretion system Vgr family protein [Methylovirgula sp.]
MPTGSPQGAGALSLSLTCNAIPQSNIASVDFIRGDEAISTTYSFEVTFTTFASLTPANIIGQPIKIQINPGTDTLVASGIVFSLFTGDPALNGHFVYRAVVMPRLKLLDLNARNQIFGTQTAVTISDLIDQLLAGTLDGQSDITNASQPNISHESRLHGTNYPARDFLVQYGESDLAFLSRRCEAAGIFYFFEQGSGGNGTADEKVVFGDGNVAFDTSSLSNNGALPYMVHQTIALASDNTAISFCALAQALPASVYLRDYNEMTPTVNLLSHASVGSSGNGNVVEYGQNFSTTSDGDALATIRSQEIACRGNVFRGVSTAPQLRPGYIFTLTGHPNSVMDNVQYVVTKIVHRAGTPIGSGQDSGAASENYHNEFEAIPFNVPFRPQRVTPQPIAAGLFSAKVDSSGDGHRADIDPNGRYKLRLFYDESTSPAGSSSSYVRKAGPYAGKNDSGMDFPLLKDTEVVVSFVNGDPDRPIIVGAAANPNTPDVVNKNNETRNRIKTTSEVLFEIEDGAPPAANGKPSNFLRFSVPGTATSYMRLGVQADGDAAAAATGATPPPWGTGLTPTTTTVSVSGISGSSVAGDNSASSASSSDAAESIYNETHTTTNVGTASQYTDGVLVGSEKNLITNIGNAALTLIGAGATTEVATNDYTTKVVTGAFNIKAQQGVYATAGDASNPTNILLEAYGYVKTKSHGNSYVWSSSDSYTLIDGNKYQTVIGNTISFTHGYNESTIWGRTNSYVMGGRLTMYLGAGLTMSLASDLKIVCPGEVKMAMPFDLKIILGTDVKFVTGTDFKIVGTDLKICLFGDQKVVAYKNELSGIKTTSDALRYMSGAVLTEGLGIKTAVKSIDCELDELATQIAAAIVFQ